MDDFFTKMQKLSDTHLRQLAVMCAGTALLLMAAVFVGNGGMAEVSTLLRTGQITVTSQTGSVFHSNTTSLSLVGLYNIQDNVAPGTPVTWVWNAGTYGANTWSQACEASASFGRTVGQGFGQTGQSIDTSTECNLSTSQPTWPLPDGNPGNVDWNKNGDGYYGPSGGASPLGYGVPGGRLTIPAPSTPGTYTYYMCSYWISHKYGNGCATNTLTVVAPASPPPVTPTTITSFTANPPSVVSGNSSTLAWTGAKGALFLGCDLRGGQWGDGTWFSALPGSITTNPLTTTTTYNISCVDNNGVSTGWNPATVVVTSPPPPASCPSGDTGTYPNCVALPPPSCPSGDTGTYPNCVAPPQQQTCSNGLNYAAYGPACTCPSGQYQPLGGTSCAVLPVCPNGLSQAYSPDCTCPSGQVQVEGGSTCVPAGAINSLTANPSRVLKGNPVDITWSTSNMGGGCALTSLDASGSKLLSSLVSSVVHPTINGKTIVTLTCSDKAGIPYSSSVTVNLIPQTTEQ